MQSHLELYMELYMELSMGLKVEQKGEKQMGDRKLIDKIRVEERPSARQKFSFIHSFTSTHLIGSRKVAFKSAQFSLKYKTLIV